MNRNKKILHKAAVNVLGLTLASVMAAGTIGELASPVSVWAAQTQDNKENHKKETGKTVYLNGSAKASEKADGSTKEKAVSSFQEALKCVGENGVILVSGTVVLDEKTELQIPSGVTVKRSEGFEGKLIKITGKGSLTLLGTGIQTDDVDTESAEAGKEAFQMKKAEEEKAPEKEPETEQPDTPETEPNTTEPQPEGEKPGEAEPQPEAESPEKEPETEQSAAPEEEQKPEQPDTPEKEPNTTESQPEGEKPGEPESQPEAESPEKEPETEQSAAPEEEQKPEQPNTPEKEPEKTEEPEPQPEAEKPNAKPEEKQEADLKVPEKLKFQTKAEWEAFQFEKEKDFAGEGTFAWEGNTDLTAYETQMTLRFIPENLETWDYTKTAGWEEDSQTVVRKIQVFIEEFKETEEPETEEEQKPEQPQKPEEPQNTSKEEPEEDVKEESKEDVTIIPVEPAAPEEEQQEQTKPPVENSAKPGKLGEVAQEAPEAIPVGSLIDESGVQVSADFLPFYVDLQVSYNDDISQLPDAGIGEILSAYELKLWDLKEDIEYQIPEGKKVKVLIPLPENADCYSDLAIAHYLGNNEYEYFIFDKDGKVGNMTIEVKDGIEYLAFETASFSPFNVGGHQIVGPGISSPGHKPSTGTGSQATQQPTQQQQTQQNNNTSGQNNTTHQSSQGTSAAQKKPGKQNTSGTGNSNVTIIPAVKTGDNTDIAGYVLLGAGALALGAGAVVVGKKKKNQNK